jgi:hypothetical protein
MQSNPNAPLTERGRLRLVIEHLGEGRTLLTQLDAGHGCCFAEASATASAVPTAGLPGTDQAA